MLTIAFGDAVLRRDLMIRSDRVRRWVTSGGELREERKMELVAPVVSGSWSGDRPVSVWAYCSDFHLGEPLEGQEPMTVNLE